MSDFVDIYEFLLQLFLFTAGPLMAAAVSFNLEI